LRQPEALSPEDAGIAAGHELLRRFWTLVAARGVATLEAWIAS
jgi:hypothetical protein